MDPVHAHLVIPSFALNPWVWRVLVSHRTGVFRLLRRRRPRHCALAGTVPAGEATTGHPCTPGAFGEPARTGQQAKFCLWCPHFFARRSFWEMGFLSGTRFVARGSLFNFCRGETACHSNLSGWGFRAHASQAHSPRPLALRGPRGFAFKFLGGCTPTQQIFIAAIAPHCFHFVC